MSRELEELLAPTPQIPWEDAASFLVAVKDATKTAAQKEEEEAESEGRVSKFLREGKSKKAEMEKRSAVPFDPKKARSMPNLGETHEGWGLRRAAELTKDPEERARLQKYRARHVARRKAAFHAKHGTTEEIRARNKAMDAERMKNPAFRKRMAEASAAHAARLKDPEYQKKLQASRARLGLDTKVAHVRELWKLAQGEGEPITEAEEGFSGVAPGSAPVEPAAIEGAGPPQAVAQGKPGKLMPPQTPEHRQMQEAVARLEQEQMADQVAMANEADHYRQVAEETGAQAQQLEAALQEAQMALDQTGQQAQMAQMQAQEATQMAQQQAQQDAAEKQQLSDEGLAAKQNIMQMRQAMQSYRENLQQIALQDPTAAAGPSPEEQGQGPTPGELQSMMADQQMAKEDQAAAQGKAPPTAAAPPGGGAPPAEPGSPEDMAALEEEAAQEAAQEAAGGKKPPKKKEKKEEGGAPKVEVNVEKKSSAIPELLLEELPFAKAAASWKERAMGAAVGAPLFAGIQSLSDIKGKGGESKKEKKLRMKLRELESKKDPGALHKHKTTITRTLYETARTNREHPRSAAIIAGLTGAGLGATVGPDVGRAVKGAFGRIAKRGGR